MYLIIPKYNIIPMIILQNNNFLIIMQKCPDRGARPLSCVLKGMGTSGLRMRHRFGGTVGMRFLRNTIKFLSEKENL